MDKLGLRAGTYAVVTLHRPANVDDPHNLIEILSALEEIANDLPVVFPVHPRTLHQLNGNGRRIATPKATGTQNDLHLIEPLGYLDFLQLYSNARAVITDSGGLQEETTYLGIPCLTLRPNTERPITITSGTNQLVESRCEEIIRSVQNIVTGKPENACVPPLWDGHAAERIVEVLRNA